MNTLEQYVVSCQKSLLSSERAIAYLCAHRKFKWEHISPFYLGYDEAQDAIVIPLLDEKRRILSIGLNQWEGKPKYLNDRHFKQNRWLYGLHLLPASDRPLVIVEGQYDAISLRRLGWPAYAVMGSHFSPWQAGHVAYITKQPVVLVYPDKDNPKLVDEVRKEMRGLGVKVKTPYYPYPEWVGEKEDPDFLCKQAPEYLIRQLEETIRERTSSPLHQVLRQCADSGH